MPRTLPIAALLLATALFAPHRDRPPTDAPLALVLAPLPGGDAAAREIARLQREARGGAPRALEQLGWAFVASASSDDEHGDYTLAERAARALEERAPGDPAGRLLRGHALASLHRFAEAEVIARDLARRRGLPADHGLLGDALLGQGRLAEAAAAYQAMMDLRPDAHAFARAAQLRWLTGDAAGAVLAMQSAARAVSPRSREGFAWIWAERALHELRNGDTAAAEGSVATALAVHPDGAAALVVRGRVLLAQDRLAEAVEPLTRAAARSPLPETLWLLAEALRAAGRDTEARRAEEQLVATGEGSDPRGLALFLASRHRDLPRALALAQRELGVRQDVHTLAALGFARAAAGDPRGGWPLLQQALAPGTPDPRLHLHAGLVAAAAGRADAARWLRRAQDGRRLLLPSERAELARALAALPASAGRRRS